MLKAPTARGGRFLSDTSRAAVKFFYFIFVRYITFSTSGSSLNCRPPAAIGSSPDGVTGGGKNFGSRRQGSLRLLSGVLPPAFARSSVRWRQFKQPDLRGRRPHETEIEFFDLELEIIEGGHEGQLPLELFVLVLEAGEELFALVDLLAQQVDLAPLPDITDPRTAHEHAKQERFDRRSETDCRRL